MTSDYIYVIWLDEEDWDDSYHPVCSYTPIGFYDDPYEAHKALMDIIDNDSINFPPEYTKPLKEGNDWAFRAVLNGYFYRTIRITEESKNHILNRMEEILELENDEGVIKWLN